jgi:hypothetical protein
MSDPARAPKRTGEQLRQEVQAACRKEPCLKAGGGTRVPLLPAYQGGEVSYTDDDRKAFFLSVALGSIHDIRKLEPTGSRRHRKMMDLEDRVTAAVDEYRPEAWQPVMMEKAGKLLDRINEWIEAEFP